MTVLAAGFLLLSCVASGGTAPGMNGAAASGPAPPQDAETDTPPDETPTAGQEGAETAASRTGAVTVELGEAIAIALRENFGLLASADAVTSARLGEAVARADFYPQVTPRFTRSPDEMIVGATVDQNLPWSGGSLRGDFTTRSPRATTAARSSDLRVTLDQPLLRGFGPTASLFALRNARRARQGQERTLALAAQDLLLRVTESFFQVVKQRQLLEVARQSLKRSESLKAASQARMQVGMVSKLDVFRAEIQASQALEAVVAAETGLEASLESFRVLLALPPRAAVEPAPIQLDTEASSEVEPVDVLVERAVAQRLDVAESRDRVDDARRALAYARQGLLPTLDLSVEMSQTGLGSSLGESLRALDRRVGLTVTAGFPVQRSAESARRALGALNLRAAQRSLREREMRVEAEVLSAVRQLERLRKSIALQRQGLDFAEQQQRLATLRYQRGLASNFDVVDAEGNLVSARTALVNLLTDLVVARTELLRVTGALAIPSGSPP